MQQENHHEAKPERICAKRFAEVIGKAGAEGIGQHGEEEQKRAEKFEQFTVDDLDLIME